MISSQSFKKQFISLILSAWIVPAIFGLSFLMYIELFTPAQMYDIMTNPIEPIFIAIAIFLAYKYFSRFSKRVVNFLDNEGNVRKEDILNDIQRFPIRFWSALLIYLIVAPFTVIYSAEVFSDFVATPIDWFRINLVSLIVSIIVGLPIFFLIMDLYGKITNHLNIQKPVVSIKLKVFLIGALVPLLIDTMLVQYYWTRTQYFTYETFFIWLSLEILAIAGSLVFVKSFSQSLAPLHNVVASESLDIEDLNKLQPLSTDELGILAIKYHLLLQELHNEQIFLEEKVDERTADLAEALKDLKSFSYSVSHDLRAPIRHILSFSELMQDECDDQLNSEAKRYLEKICHSANRMLTIIEQMLKLSQISDKQIVKESVNLSLYANYHFDLLANTIRDRKVTIDVEPDLEVMGDEDMLMLLMENLINNAWKYTSKETEAKIAFGYDKIKKAFFVKDNGAGFNMQYADKLFIPFQRLHSDSEFEGAGIGLATVSRIIRKHNGKIWAESEPGKGSTFYFQL